MIFLHQIVQHVIHDSILLDIKHIIQLEVVVLTVQINRIMPIIQVMDLVIIVNGHVIQIIHIIRLRIVVYEVLFQF